MKWPFFSKLAMIQILNVQHIFYAFFMHCRLGGVKHETLKGVLKSTSVGDSVLLGDFNAHVGNDSEIWRGETAPLI